MGDNTDTLAVISVKLDRIEGRQAEILRQLKALNGSVRENSVGLAVMQQWRQDHAGTHAVQNRRLDEVDDRVTRWVVVSTGISGVASAIAAAIARYLP